MAALKVHVDLSTVRFNRRSNADGVRRRNQLFDLRTKIEKIAALNGNKTAGPPTFLVERERVRTRSATKNLQTLMR